MRIDSMELFQQSSAMRLRLKSDSVYSTVLSVILFNLAWLSLVLLTADGIFPASLIIIASLVFLPYTTKQLLASVVIAGVGISVDSLLLAGGLMDFGTVFLPFWLVMLWLGFALVVHFGLSFLFRLPLLVQSLFGAAGGSSSYYAGMVAGSVTFPQSTTLTVLVFALVWAIMLPLFVYLAVRCRTNSSKSQLNL